MGTETWLNPSITNSEIFPPEFDVYRRDRSSRGGGTLVATKKSLISHQIPSNPSAEAVLVSVQTNDKSSNLVVGSLYRPPSATSDQETAALLDVFDRACRRKKDVVWLGGDLNLPDIEWDSCSIVGHQYPKTMNTAFLNKFQDCGMFQTNRNPTREDAILDYFLTNRPSLTTRTTTTPGLSDHDIVLTDSTVRPARIKPVPRLVQIWKKADIPSLKKDVANFTEELLHTDPDTTSVQETWDRMHAALIKTLKDNVPTTTCSTKAHVPWMNTVIKRLSQRKNRAWKKAKRSRKEKDWQRFKSLQKKARKACRKAHNKYVTDMIAEDGDTKKMWKYIKSKSCEASGVAILKKKKA